MNIPLPPGVISCAQFAKRRGVTPMAVTGAVKDGRLRESVIRTCCWQVGCACVPRGDPKIRDYDQACREWDDNTNRTHHSSVKIPTIPRVQIAEQVTGQAPAHITAGEAATNEKHWKAKKAELDYRKAASELVSKLAVIKEQSKRNGAAKTKLLGIPSRYKQRFPDLTLEHMAELEALIRESLQEIADGR